MVLGCSCANSRPPSGAARGLSALSNPCQASCHVAPAAMTPGIAVTVTARGSLSGVIAGCCCGGVWLRARADCQTHQAITNTAFDFMSAGPTVFPGRQGPPDCGYAC